MNETTNAESAEDKEAFGLFGHIKLTPRIRR